MRGMEGIAVRGKALAAYWSVEVSEGSARADKVEWASRATVIATGWTALAGVAWLLHPIDAAWWRLVGTVGGCWALAVLMRRAPFASRAPVEAPPIGSAAGVAVERGESVGEGRVRHQETQDGDRGQCRPEAVFAHALEHAPAGVGGDQAGGAPVGVPLAPAVERGPDGRGQHIAAEAIREENK